VIFRVSVTCQALTHRVSVTRVEVLATTVMRLAVVAKARTKQALTSQGQH